MSIDLQALAGLNILSVELAVESDGSPYVTLERVRRRGHPDRWAVRRWGSVLARTGEFEHEPMPSSRDEAFFERCRFATVGDALAVWREHVAHERAEYDARHVRCLGLTADGAETTAAL